MRREISPTVDTIFSIMPRLQARCSSPGDHAASTEGQTAFRGDAF